MADSFVRISELPESNDFQPDDYLVKENELDTWKVKMKYFDQYIKDKVDIYEQNIVNIVNNKINEIQIINTTTQEIITQINAKIHDFEDAEIDRRNSEREREQNEEIRQKNEQDRQNKYNEASINESNREKNEDNRKAAEIARQNAENTRVSNENTRKDNEQQRQQNEQDREDAEAARQRAEGIRVTNENNRNTDESRRQTNETDRINRFNDMEDIIDNFNTFLHNNIKEGISVLAENNSGRFIPIIEIAIPKEHLISDNPLKYNMLMYMSIGTHLKNMSNTSAMYKWPNSTPGGNFFSVEIFMDVDRGSYNQVSKLTIAFHSMESLLSSNSFNGIDTNNGFNLVANYTMQNESCIITIYLGLNGYTKFVSTSILWDNILKFKSNASPYYSKALNDQTYAVFKDISYDGDQFINGKTYTLDIIYDGSSNHPWEPYLIDNMPRGFIDILHSLYMYSKGIYYDLTERELYKFYPVGSIYISTIPNNPGITINAAGTTITGVLGGGTWELICGEGINYKWDDVNSGVVNSNTVTIYIWKRLA